MNKAVAELVETEERIIEEHRAVLQSEKEMLAEEEKLIDEVEAVDGDTEGGCFGSTLFLWGRLFSPARLTLVNKNREIATTQE